MQCVLTSQAICVAVRMAQCITESQNLGSSLSSAENGGIALTSRNASLIFKRSKFGLISVFDALKLTLQIVNML